MPTNRGSAVLEIENVSKNCGEPRFRFVLDRLTPRFLKVLNARTDVVAARQSPLHPTAWASRLFGHDGADTLGVRLGVTPIRLVEAEFS